uniref:Uncharacterized protein n=1 Tax=Anguilla anguilla TaxID=7936 RepID=A0A0E9U3F3_ANGAN
MRCYNKAELYSCIPSSRGRKGDDMQGRKIDFQAVLRGNKQFHAFEPKTKYSDVLPSFFLH